MIRISDERARAIAEAAIVFEAAKDKASMKFVEHEKHRRWDGNAYVYDIPNEAWKKSQWQLESFQQDRDRKRRAYQRQIKSALLEAVG